MTEHTKRAWTYTRDDTDTRWIIDSAPAYAVACTAGYACDDEDVARLIAAAPDLLAALEKAVERQGFSNEELIDARAAIRKAKGEV